MLRTKFQVSIQSLILTAVLLRTHLLGSADAVQMLHRTNISIRSPYDQSQHIPLRSKTTTQQSTGSEKSKPENTLGKYGTSTMGIAYVKNFSKFPAAATVAATFTSAIVIIHELKTEKLIAATFLKACASPGNTSSDKFSANLNELLTLCHK